MIFKVKLGIHPLKSNQILLVSLTVMPYFLTMKRIKFPNILLSLVFVITGSCNFGKNQVNNREEFQTIPGDILFQDLDCGPLCEAIEAVTQGYSGAQLSHMGLLTKDSSGALLVLEAIGTGVVETPLEDFLARSSDSEGNPKVFVSRLKQRYQHLIPYIMMEKEKYIGLPYNVSFVWNDSSYYCSQLIHTLFKTVNRGEDFFTLYPMTFKEPQSERYFEAWINYYNELGQEIPEGMPGLNPGGMSRSNKLEVVYVYGWPDGMLDKEKM